MTDQTPNQPKITPVILSGGGGTRLWPMSRADRPKQFLPLTSDKTMFQLTVARVMDRRAYAPPLIVANVNHVDIVKGQLAEIGVDDATLLLEPSARNTAPAIALAALAVEDQSTPLLIMPSDHIILEEERFHEATRALLPFVAKDWLATYGIMPTGPETGYGYIQAGEALSSPVQSVLRFVEKPDKLRAEAMIAAGNHVWNGGIFLFRADAYLGILAKEAPTMRAAAEQAMAAARRDDQSIFPDAEAFAASPSDSIDYAVMEKAEKVAVVPVSMGWSDVGSWDALYDIGENRTAGAATAIGVTNSLIRSDGVRVHAAGIEDLIVIASGNDVLIVPRGQSQDVKKIVEALREQS